MALQSRPLGDFLDGEVELVAGDEIDGLASFPDCVCGSTATLAPTNPALSRGFAALSASMTRTSEAKDGVEVCSTARS